jgi:serine/threonine protein kinase
LLHQRNIVHTNLSPEHIFLRKGDINKMCFLNLYHVSWKSKEILKNTGFQGPDYEDNLSLYDIRTRNANYVSSEQIKIFEELMQIAMLKNGKLDPDSYEIQEFLLLKKYQRTNGISKLSDIYSIGAIMFKLLLGRAPTQHISKYIAEHNL